MIYTISNPRTTEGIAIIPTAGIQRLFHLGRVFGGIYIEKKGRKAKYINY
jgi:hypothetical protein